MMTPLLASVLLLQVKAPPLAMVDATAIERTNERLLLGTRDGTVYGYEAESGRAKYVLKGESAPVTDIVRVEGWVFWSVQGSPRVQFLNPDLSQASADLSAVGVTGPIRRLQAWREYVLVEAESGHALIRAKDRAVLPLGAAFPPNVVSVAQQGSLLVNWAGKRGMAVTVRKVGTYKTAPEPGGSTDIALLTGFAFDAQGRARQIGNYTCAVGDFVEAPGERVRWSFGETQVDLPRAVTAAGNIRIGPEGIIVLTQNQVLTIPMAKRNWETTWRTVAYPPRYSQTASFAGDTIWWWSGDRLMGANIQDGSVRAVVPRNRSLRVRAVLADMEGGFVVTNQGMRRFEDGRLPGFVAYDLGGPIDDRTSEQRSLARVLGSGDTLAQLATKPDPIASALTLSRVPGATKRISTGLRVDAPEYGDVVVQGGRRGFYVGEGQVLRWEGGRVVTEDLRVDDGLRILRVLQTEAQRYASSRPVSGGLLEGIVPLGLRRPQPWLGHNLFVRTNIGGPYDRPYKPEHFRLLQIAESWIGTPYVFGGNSRDGIDCSGFVQQVFLSMGIRLPRHSQTMGRAAIGTVVTDELRFGDVLVFPSPKHVALYVGNGRTIEAVRGGVGRSNIARRSIAVVRRFL